MRREVVPEILDGLPMDDARAVRSRRDLRFVNALMGNERWIQREVSRRAEVDWRVAELGAGQGHLSKQLADHHRSCTGYDLVARPEGLSTQINWRQGNFFETLGEDASEVMVGSLILHHFQDEELLKLGEIFSQSRLLVFAEPLRSRLALTEGKILLPLVNDVTRHDMLVSIRAGFRKGELAHLLGLSGDWRWHESVTLRGGLRSVAWRKRGHSEKS
jgi:hypothetical protein